MSTDPPHQNHERSCSVTASPGRSEPFLVQGLSHHASHFSIIYSPFLQVRWQSEAEHISISQLCLSPKDRPPEGCAEVSPIGKEVSIKYRGFWRGMMVPAVAAACDVTHKRTIVYPSNSPVPGFQLPGRTTPAPRVLTAV